MGELLYEKLAVTRENMSEREESYSTDVEEFSESGGTDPSDSSMISSNDSDGNEELGVQSYLCEPETNTEGNANITVLFYEITEKEDIDKIGRPPM